MDALPCEIIENILRKIPTRHLLTVSHVNQLFNQLALPLITECESYLWRKRTREDPSGARSLITKFASLQVLNMDYCQPMFDNMTSEQIEAFASDLAHNCQKISTVFMSDIICFRIIHAYVMKMQQLSIPNRLTKLVIFIDSDEWREERELLLEEIRQRSPGIEKLDVTRIEPIVERTASSERLASS